jgi:predicted GNAT family N-acyltransferase
MLKVFRICSSDTLFSEARRIREQVFVREQGVSLQDEYDQYEAESKHLLVQYKGQYVGVARWRKKELAIKLERFAVLPSYRGLGIGKRLVNEVIADVLPLKIPIFLHAQIPVIEFYSGLGFVKVGLMFEEANIQHYKMEFKPDKSNS